MQDFLRVYSGIAYIIRAQGREYSSFLRQNCYRVFIYIVTVFLYTQPKSVFIHSIHRVIHKSTGEKWRNIAVSPEVIHIIHRFSTVVIHGANHVDILVDIPFCRFLAVYIYDECAYLYTFVHVRRENHEGYGLFCPRNPHLRKLSLVTKM